MVYFFISLLGLAFGSFASVIIHRLHTQEKGIFKGRSKCPHCKKQLETRDLIPVLSYLINRAKCRFCKKSISARYLLLELSMAGLFILTTLLIGPENKGELIFYLFISFVFVILTFYDFLFQEVPDEISLPAILITIIYMLVTEKIGWLSLGVGVAVPVLFFSTLHFASQGRWLGGGDIRIGGLMGALLGWPVVLIGLFFGYLTGSIYSLLGVVAGKFNRKTQIPFVPFLLSGAYIAIFWGEALLDWYGNFLWLV